MRNEFQLFLSTLTTLLAVVNPLEAMPVFLLLMQGKDKGEHSRVAAMSCIYATALMLFFLLFGTLIMRFFGVPLSMVRIAGGIVLTRIGFDLFSPSRADGATGLATPGANANIAFMPLAMPLMFGPGVIATVIGMASTVKGVKAEIVAMAPISLGIVATGFITYICLLFSATLSNRLGAMGIDAATKIVGFFVAAMGVGLVFDGVLEALNTHAWH